MAAGTVVSQHEWLRVGAAEKARSVVELTQALPHETILEIGSGSGAVLEALAEQGFGSSYFAVEPSEPLFDQMMTHPRIPALTAENRLFRDSSFTDRRFDLVILSHVIEHVADPADLVLQASHVSDSLVIEVPLEGSLTGNMRAAIKGFITKRDRRLNRAGHINFFSQRDLDNLVTWCGLEVKSRRIYNPSAQLRYQTSRGGNLTRLTSRMSLSAAKLIGDDNWARAYYGHYAVLAVPRELPVTADDDASSSQPLYFPPSARAT